MKHNPIQDPVKHPQPDRRIDHQASQHKGLKHTARAELSKLAKLTLLEAIEVACRQSPGRPIGAELEEKHGRLIYKVKIVSDDKLIRKVKIDAISKEVIDLKTKSH
jgi:uncharacterized membrane protein YkoI